MNPSRLEPHLKIEPKPLNYRAIKQSMFKNWRNVMVEVVDVTLMYSRWRYAPTSCLRSAIIEKKKCLRFRVTSGGKCCSRHFIYLKTNNAQTAVYSDVEDPRW
ncbi:hypothetical protein GOODEAATRI_002564 [Goodea atripinnis]|uniref:Uncharacterized protein n=1 Tax=Goodea atripinnis TaxID=208336 RepID=A0ABV0NGY0_9TELE